MIMATLTLKLPLSEGREAAPATRGSFWRRMFDAMVEARMRQAQMELNRYQFLIPTDPVKDAGYRVGLKNVGALPFVR
jgi:hypothetical protein